MDEDPEDILAEANELLAVVTDCWVSENLSDAVVSLDEAISKLTALRERFNQKLESKE